jgi:hypothetical protein
MIPGILVSNRDHWDVLSMAIVPYETANAVADNFLTLPPAHSARERYDFGAKMPQRGGLAVRGLP